tara:strand:- start:466 stop:1179 length:714 start_codon:yes stop_codon:yes gene_type:complete
MFVTTEGIVLRVYPFKDNKCIAKIFTKDYGLVSFIVKKTKNQIILSQQLTVAEITYRKTKNKDLFYVKETHIKYVYNNIMLNYAKRQYSIVLCDLLHKCLKEPNSNIYEFMAESFNWLNGVDKYCVGFDSLFLIHLCEKSGISPFTNVKDYCQEKKLDILEGKFAKNSMVSNKKHVVPIKESVALYQLAKLDFDDLKNYNLAESLNASMFNYLILYISTHLSEVKSLKSVQLLKDIV